MSMQLDSPAVNDNDRDSDSDDSSSDTNTTASTATGTAARRTSRKVSSLQAGGARKSFVRRGTTTSNSSSGARGSFALPAAAAAVARRGTVQRQPSVRSAITRSGSGVVSDRRASQAARRSTKTAIQLPSADTRTAAAVLQRFNSSRQSISQGSSRRPSSVRRQSSLRRSPTASPKSRKNTAVRNKDAAAAAAAYRLGYDKQIAPRAWLQVTHRPENVENEEVRLSEELVSRQQISVEELLQAGEVDHNTAVNSAAAATGRAATSSGHGGAGNIAERLWQEPFVIVQRSSKGRRNKSGYHAGDELDGASLYSGAEPGAVTADSVNAFVEGDFTGDGADDAADDTAAKLAALRAARKERQQQQLRNGHRTAVAAAAADEQASMASGTLHMHALATTDGSVSTATSGSGQQQAAAPWERFTVDANISALLKRAVKPAATAAAAAAGDDTAAASTDWETIDSVQERAARQRSAAVERLSNGVIAALPQYALIAPLHKQQIVSLTSDLRAVQNKYSRLRKVQSLEVAVQEQQQRAAQIERGVLTSTLMSSPRHHLGHVTPTAASTPR
eukprot:3705-Heterococcus_DN1.PRE.1